MPRQRVGIVPKAEVGSFDHIVCEGKKRGGNCQTKHLRSFQVDEHPVLGRFLDWQIGGLPTFEYFVDIVGGAAEKRWYVRSIGQKPPTFTNSSLWNTEGRR
jgi:hypothetical protein